jgi:hypothetical protein
MHVPNALFFVGEDGLCTLDATCLLGEEQQYLTASVITGRRTHR